MATEVETRRDRPVRPWDLFEMPDMSRWFQGLRPLLRDEDRLRIEQEVSDDTMMIRAEMPGIDPAKDVDITLDDGVLSICAERRSEVSEEQSGRTWSEFRYGSFARAVRVPKDMDPRRGHGQLQGRHPRGEVPLQGADRSATAQGHRHHVAVAFCAGRTARPRPAQPWPRRRCAHAAGGTTRRDPLARRRHGAGQPSPRRLSHS